VESSIDKLTSAGSFVGLTENVGGQYQSTENLKVDDVLTGRTFEIIVSSSTGGSVGPEDLPELFKLGAPVGQGAQPLLLNSGGDVPGWGKQKNPPLSRRSSCSTCTTSTERARSPSARKSPGLPSEAPCDMAVDRTAESAPA